MKFIIKIKEEKNIIVPIVFHISPKSSITNESPCMKKSKMTNMIKKFRQSSTNSTKPAKMVIPSF